MNDPSPENCTFLVGLGSNLLSPVGDPFMTVHWAVESFRRQPGWVVSASRYFRSPIYPPGDVPDFVNAAVVVQCPLQPLEILDFAHGLEARCNRSRSRRWESRTLDIDIIAMDQGVIPSKSVLLRWMNMSLAEQEHAVPDELLLPHPRMHERGFVLIPLLDVASDWTHPIHRHSVREMVNMLPDIAVRGVEPLGPGLGQTGN